MWWQLRRAEHHQVGVDRGRNLVRRVFRAAPLLLGPKLHFGIILSLQLLGDPLVLCFRLSAPPCSLESLTVFLISAAFSRRHATCSVVANDLGSRLAVKLLLELDSRARIRLGCRLRPCPLSSLPIELLLKRSSGFSVFSFQNYLAQDSLLKYPSSTSSTVQSIILLLTSACSLVRTVVGGRANRV